MNTPSQSVDAPRQSNTDPMIDTGHIVLDTDLDFLNLKEVAAILRISTVSVYRLIARRAIPVYRACRRVLFKKRDVIEYLERHRKDASEYGRPEG